MRDQESMGRSTRPWNIVLQDITIDCLVSKDITIDCWDVEEYYLWLLSVEGLEIGSFCIISQIFTCTDNFQINLWLSISILCTYTPQIVDLDPMYVYAPDCRSRCYVRIRPRLSISIQCTYTPQIVDLDPMYVYAPDCRSRSNVRIRPRFSLQNILDQKIILIYLIFFLFFSFLGNARSCSVRKCRKNENLPLYRQLCPQKQQGRLFQVQGYKLDWKILSTDKFFILYVLIYTFMIYFLILLPKISIIFPTIQRIEFLIFFSIYAPVQYSDVIVQFLNLDKSHLF